MVVAANHYWEVEETPGAVKHMTHTHSSNSAETHMRNFTIVIHILQMKKLKSYSQERVETWFDSRQTYSKALTVKYFVSDFLFVGFVSCDYRILVNRIRVSQLWTNFAKQDLWRCHVYGLLRDLTLPLGFISRLQNPLKMNIVSCEWIKRVVLCADIFHFWLQWKKI